MGMDRGQQLRDGGSCAAMVRHLEQVCLRLLLSDSLLRFSLGVSFQQGGSFSVNQFQHQRFVIAPHSEALGVGRQNTDLCPAKVEAVAHSVLNHAYA